jgi:hypothetical protein
MALCAPREFDKCIKRHRAMPRHSATSAVLQAISSSLGELDPVFRTILGNATRICEAKFGNLCFYTGGGFRLVARRRGFRPGGEPDLQQINSHRLDDVLELSDAIADVVLTSGSGRCSRIGNCSLV